MADRGYNVGETYLNPVYRRSFPDPFVLKHCNQYFAYCTGHAADGQLFQILRSDDLVNWHELGGAMQPLAGDAPYYWAPEVTYHNGKFYLYYSVGNETLMHLRVAVSERPDGGFVDAGKALTGEEFAIDAHVFRDVGGRWYMFYATDFLTHTHIGTGTVVDRMFDPFTLAGEPRPVVRAKYDWQVYDAARAERGGVRWHTVEGPFVLKRKGLYFEIFSGGNWQNLTYGVSFALTNDIGDRDEWRQFSDGNKTLPILRTLPDRVVGPGHNSVIRGPNNRELYCVYHSWVDGERVLSIDRMDFAAPDRLFVSGPTYTPQPLPYSPDIGSTCEDAPEPRWRTLAGQWTSDAGEFVSAGGGASELAIDVSGSSFLCEVYIGAGDDANHCYGITLRSSGAAELTFMLDPARLRAAADWTAGRNPRYVPLPPGFDATALQLLRVDVDDHQAVFSVNDVDIVISTPIPTEVASIALAAGGRGARFSAFSLTYGFEERFEDDALEARGWNVPAAGAIVRSGTLIMTAGDGQPVTVSKPVRAGDLELVINLCVNRFFTGDAAISFGCGTQLVLRGPSPLTVEANDRVTAVIDDYRPGYFTQFRMVRRGDRIDCYHEDKHFAQLLAGPADNIEISVRDAEAAIEMVRFTAI